ncbi:esterase E4-like [Diaphorina citri]|uniref:Esterase E4-like n=1 Tax=Diaphorina citri TaxID=121845 RepID=A0A3Q0JII1_DIACI|nr:esterase E4-like [Diaphorina citri]
MNAHHLLHLFLYLTVVSIGFCKVTNITDFVPEVNIDKLGKVRGRVTMSHWTKRLIYSFQGIPYAIPPVGKMRFQVSTKLLHFVPEVNIDKLGKVRGRVTMSHWTKRLIYSFQGIPYAIPPVGKMRFQSPRPAQPWTTPLNATSLKRRCPQIFDASSNIEVLTSTEALEDCLYLNVYTPMCYFCSEQISTNVNQTEASQKLFPVIFYIHGGSFRVGSSHSMTPHYLLEKDVVLVTIQYRLGILGFLSLETNEIPGNMGFLDMLLALEWVNDHIRSFNGDKNCVTLMGQSAGGAAVTFFLTSPLVRDDLFHRAIIQSGSGLCDWSFENETGMGRQFIEDLGCRLDNVDDSFVAECLRRKSLSDLFKTYYSMEYGGKFCQAVKQTHGKKRFLTETPEESFAKGAVKNVPVLLGVTKHEGSSFLEGKSGDHSHHLAGLAVLKSCVFHTARLLSSMHNSTFLYSFHFKGRFTKYFEYRDKNDSRFPHELQLLPRTMVDLWTNFATYGYPFSEDVPDWQPVANDSLGPFLRIDERSELRKSFLEEFTIATREGVEAYYSENGGSCERTSWVHVILCTLLHLLLVKYKT